VAVLEFVLGLGGGGLSKPRQSSRPLQRRESALTFFTFGKEYKHGIHLP